MEIDRRTFLLGSAGLAMSPFRTNQNPPTVTVKQGRLAGTLEDGLRVFRGVPFAKPPVGPLRFRAPELSLPWSGDRDATKNAPPAIQSGKGDSEDCLYLNIWAPEGPGPFPVFVWIHGGGNTGGGTQGQSGATFARNGIVVVTVAYRLGALGFLELGTVLPELKQSGDNGIRDLEASLRWLEENVAAFGGDPNRITVAGESAGAKNVAALMAAPSAKGLFARAIMESGSGQTVHDRTSAGVVTVAMLSALGLREGDERRILDLTATEILKAQRKVEGSYPFAFPFRPYVGGSFLPKRPVDLIDGSIPLLIGTNRDESLLFFDPKDADTPVRSREISNTPLRTVESMATKYAASLPSASPLERRTRLLTAEEYWIPSVRFAEAHAKTGGQTWMYRFDHVSTREDDPRRGWSVHGSEMDFVWNHRNGWTMHETWVAFIKGEPPQRWPQYDGQRRATLVFGQDGKQSVVEDPRGNERRLWDGVL